MTLWSRSAICRPTASRALSSGSTAAASWPSVGQLRGAPNIPLDLDEQSSADKKGFDCVTVEIFDAHLLVPSTLHDACNAHGVVTVALVDLQLPSRLRMPGIDADDGQPHLIQLGP